MLREGVLGVVIEGRGGKKKKKENVWSLGWDGPKGGKVGRSCRRALRCAASLAGKICTHTLIAALPAVKVVLCPGACHLAPDRQAGRQAGRQAAKPSMVRLPSRSTYSSGTLRRPTDASRPAERRHAGRQAGRQPSEDMASGQLAAEPNQPRHRTRPSEATKTSQPAARNS
ncbi:uncharacterized protein BKA78DRAFT_169034 [Phyllosticta capitalensis]|uniref:uncharacterized protein n=1 Tax=Phyllosticta capitalensis TaxID=121624 RepID=UPI00312E5CBE